MRFLYGLRVSVKCRKCDAKETCFAKKCFCFKYLKKLLMNTISYIQFKKKVLHLQITRTAIKD